MKLKKKIRSSRRDTQDFDDEFINDDEISTEEDRLSKVSITMDHQDPVNEEELLAKIFSGLPGIHDIQFKILSLLPLQSIFKFRLVSKEIRRLIDEPRFMFEHFQRLSSVSPFTGLFYQYRYWCFDVKSDPFFMPTSTGNVGCGLPDPSLSFLKENFIKEAYGDDDEKQDKVKLIDSCNGLLLCKVTNNVKHIRKLYVCNPLTKQKVFVPHDSRKQFSIDNLFMLIAHQSSTKTGYQSFTLVCVHRYKPKSVFEDPCTKLWIFSSETCKWEEFKDISLPVLSPSTMIGSKVVIKDTIFLDCFEDFILVCNVNNKSLRFDLIEAPKNQFERCLWDYNGKLVCYCRGYDQCSDDFPVWSLCCGKTSNNELKRWEIENFEEFKFLVEDARTGYNKAVNQQIQIEVPPQLKIVAYDTSSKTMYLLINRSIFSYELTNRKFEWVSGHVYNDTWVLQYVHNLERIEAQA